MFLTSNTLINTNQQLMDRIRNEVLAWFNNDGKGGDVADTLRLDLDHRDHDRQVCIYLFNVQALSCLAPLRNERIVLHLSFLSCLLSILQLG